MNIKHKIFLKICITILLSISLPLLVILLINQYKTDDKELEILIAIIPLFFSIITLIISSIKTNLTEQDNLLNSINCNIEKYNKIMVKTISRYNILMDHCYQIYKILKQIEKVDEFKTIIESYYSIAKNNPEASNDEKMRETLRINLKRLIEKYLKGNQYNYILDIISKIELFNIPLENINSEDAVTIHEISSITNVKNILRRKALNYSDLYLNGAYFDGAIIIFQRNIEKIDIIYENKIRVKNITDENIFDLYYGLFLSMFSFYEKIFAEIKCLEYFQDSFSSLFKIYIEKEYLYIDGKTKKEIKVESVSGFPYEIISDNSILKYYSIVE